MKKKKGFTLAEVLITLAIIGVVAALTIPSVVKNYQETQLKTQFKKSYSTFIRIFNQTSYDLGGNVQCYTADNGSGEHYTGECEIFWNEFTKSLKTIKYCKNNALANGCVPRYTGYAASDGGCTGFSENYINNNNSVWVLADGMILIGYRTPWSLFAVDINGFKPPNKFGYDVFAFRIAQDDKKTIIISSTVSGCMGVAEGGRTTAQMFKWVFK